VSVDAEWSKGHMSAIGPYTVILLEVYVRIVNWRPGGALRWKVETVGWEGRGVRCSKPVPPRL
jgi:hypothetical protein